MKRIVSRSIPLLLVLAACGWSKPAKDPENTEEEGTSSSRSDKSEDESTAPVSHSLGSTETHHADKVTVKDETEKKSAPCGGANIPDLLAVISQANCEVPNATPEGEKQQEMKDLLEVNLTADAPRVAPGSKVNVTVTFHNKGKGPLSLDFVADPEPRFDLQVYTPKGARVDNPAGGEPSLPAEVANAPVPDRKVARATLAPQGTAKLSLSWDAVKYKWASAERAKGALPGHGYPRESAGPLPKGKYVLRVVMPMVGVAEGIDHEITQPRVPVEVGNP
jgi:hypothetical protein